MLNPVTFEFTLLNFHVATSQGVEKRDIVKLNGIDGKETGVTVNGRFQCERFNH